MESLFTDLQLRGKQVLAMITDGAAISRAAVRNLDPGSVYAADDQMDKGCCVPPKKAPIFGHTQHPLAGHNLSFSHTHNQGHLCRRECLFDV